MGRERITISIQDSLVTKIDHLIDKQEIRNRSHAIESILNKALSEQVISDLVVCIGGEKADRIATDVTMTYEKLINHGLKQIWFVLGEQGGTHEAKLRLAVPKKIESHFHVTKQGSGGGLNEILSHLSTPFWYVNTDHLDSFDWELVLHYYRSYTPIAILQHSGSHLFHGYGIAGKGIESSIPNGFSLLEDQIFSSLIQQGKMLYLP